MSFGAGGFEIDPVKNATNVEKHGLPLAVGALVILGDCVEWVDERRDYGEVRVVAVGPALPQGDKIFSVVYTWRGDRRRLISVRRASVRELREFRRRDA